MFVDKFSVVNFVVFGGRTHGVPRRGLSTGGGVGWGDYPWDFTVHFWWQEVLFPLPSPHKLQSELLILQIFLERITRYIAMSVVNFAINCIDQIILSS